MPQITSFYLAAVTDEERAVRLTKHAILLEAISFCDHIQWQCYSNPEAGSEINSTAEFSRQYKENI